MNYWLRETHCGQIRSKVQRRWKRLELRSTSYSWIFNDLYEDTGIKGTVVQTHSVKTKSKIEKKYIEMRSGYGVSVRFDDTTVGTGTVMNKVEAWKAEMDRLFFEMYHSKEKK
jgi:hypothetical protein